MNQNPIASLYLQFILKRNLTKLNLKNQLYPNSTKINALKQKIRECHNPSHINFSSYGSLEVIFFNVTSML